MLELLSFFFEFNLIKLSESFKPPQATRFLGTITKSLQWPSHFMRNCGQQTVPRYSPYKIWVSDRINGQSNMHKSSMSWNGISIVMLGRACFFHNLPQAVLPISHFSLIFLCRTDVMPLITKTNTSFQVMIGVTVFFMILDVVVSFFIILNALVSFSMKNVNVKLIIGNCVRFTSFFQSYEHEKLLIVFSSLHRPSLKRFGCRRLV